MSCLQLSTFFFIVLLCETTFFSLYPHTPFPSHHPSLLLSFYQIFLLFSFIFHLLPSLSQTNTHTHIHTHIHTLTHEYVYYIYTEILYIIYTHSPTKHSHTNTNTHKYTTKLNTYKHSILTNT